LSDWENEKLSKREFGNINHGKKEKGLGTMFKRIKTLIVNKIGMFLEQ